MFLGQTSDWNEGKRTIEFVKTKAACNYLHGDRGRDHVQSTTAQTERDALVSGQLSLTVC